MPQDHGPNTTQYSSSTPCSRLAAQICVHCSGVSSFWNNRWQVSPPHGIPPGSHVRLGEQLLELGQIHAGVDLVAQAAGADLLRADAGAGDDRFVALAGRRAGGRAGHGSGKMNAQSGSQLQPLMAMHWSPTRP
jgi:hypothetical protein